MWRHIIAQLVIMQEEILEEGRYKKNTIETNIESKVIRKYKNIFASFWKLELYQLKDYLDFHFGFEGQNPTKKVNPSHL